MKKYTIEICINAGFCSGIRRAIALGVNAAEKHGKVYTLGEPVHNDDAIRLLREKNVFLCESPLEEMPEDAVIIIRSHGVGREVYEKLEQRKSPYYDATCPYVKKIHEIVSRDYGGETVTLIAGDGRHPEVEGIVGHVNGEAFTVNSVEELEKCLQNLKNLQKLQANGGIRKNTVIFVSQTTFNQQKWGEFNKIIKKHCTNAEIFDTICNATVERQNQTRELSRKSDIMLVIGAKHSSNSVKLHEIAAENCRRTFFIENAGDLNIPQIKRQLSEFSENEDVKIGITAGASVPAEIIKEVHTIMNEEMKNVNSETEADSGFDFMAEVEKTFPPKIYAGKRVKAYVVAVNNNEIVVDLGSKHSGYIPADEVGGDPGSSIHDMVKVGDDIDCLVTKVNDAEGVVYLSKKRVDSELGFEKLTVAHSADAVLTGYVTSVVNSGVIVSYDGIRVFVPASQSGVPRDGKLETLLRKTLKFKVLEVDEQRRRIIGSIRAASRLEDDAVRAKFWQEIEVGKKFVGEIKSMESYGVFVDLGGVDGMVHLSELSWKRIRHPKEVVSIGDKLEVAVKNYDPDKKRVSLTAKNPDENPWTKFLNEYSVGDVVKVTIVNLTAFGAFAQICPGIDGLIHVSQISHTKVKNSQEVLTVGQEVETQITEIDIEKTRVSLSIKALLEPPTETAEETVETVEASAETSEEAAE